MRNWSKGLIFSLLIISMVFPILPLAAKAQATIPTFKVGAVGPVDLTYVLSNWDTTCYGASTGDYFRHNALELLFDYPYNSPDGNYDKLVPVLATNWTIHPRDNEMNLAGFTNYNGYDYMDITLRENVKFHDGSDWNATVAKWNIDRHMYILGNINNCLGSTASIPYSVTSNRGIYWLTVADWAPYTTESGSWNVTTKEGYAFTSTLHVNYYPGYGYSSPTDYYAYNKFPRFTNITILDNKESGGTIRVFFNDWGTGPQYLALMRFISMEAYEDYFDVPILGYGNVASFPQNNATSPFPGHLIGTGPYMFEEYSTVTDTGTMARFDDWWNATAQQAKGWHMVPEVAVVMYPHSSAGYTSRTVALTAGDIDFAYDRSWEPLDYTAVQAIPSLKYIEMGQENYGEVLVLNCIDETYLRYWYDIHLNITAAHISTTPKYLFPNGTLRPVEGGVDRAFRKALSYAFNYDQLLALSSGRLVRSGGLVAATHEYYDPTVNLAYRDLTIARQTLFDDPIWGYECDIRGLDVNSTDQDWIDVAEGVNPIYTFDYHYDNAHLNTLAVLTQSLKDIGCAIAATLDLPDTYSLLTHPTAYVFPTFSVDGYAIKVYHDRINDLGYIAAYRQSTGVKEEEPYPGYGVIANYDVTKSLGYMFPLRAGANMGFTYNATCDDLIARLWFQNSTGKQELYSELADWDQNYQYPVLYLANDLTGRAMNKDWETAWPWIFMLHFDLVKYSPTAPPAIPGFSVGIVVAASLIAFIAVIYNFMKRRKNL